TCSSCLPARSERSTCTATFSAGTARSVGRTQLFRTCRTVSRERFSLSPILSNQKNLLLVKSQQPHVSCSCAAPDTVAHFYSLMMDESFSVFRMKCPHFG